MSNKLNSKEFLLNYQADSRAIAENEQIESIKSITCLLLRKIEALENNSTEVSFDALTKGSNLYEVITSFEKNLIKHALRETNWSQKRAAQILGVKVTTLNAKIKRYDINVKSGDNFSQHA